MTSPLPCATPSKKTNNSGVCKINAPAGGKGLQETKILLDSRQHLRSDGLRTQIPHWRMVFIRPPTDRKPTEPERLQIQQNWLFMLKNSRITGVVLIAAFFLVILGMRTPTLDHNGGPKLRPRAVIEDASKASTTICADLHLDAELCPTFAITAHSESRTFYTPVASNTTSLVRHFLPSRASPSSCRLS